MSATVYATCCTPGPLRSRNFAMVDSGLSGASSCTQPPAGVGPTESIASRTPCSVLVSVCTQRMPKTRS